MAVKLIDDPKPPTGRDRVIVPGVGAATWARFYDLETNQPIYVGREGVKHAHLEDIENERRAGYAYTGAWPVELLPKGYARWRQQREQ